MNQKIYIVDGRQFRTELDYNRALHDKKIIDKLREDVGKYNMEQLEKLLKELQEDKYPFFTLLGKDFEEEIEEHIAGKSMDSKVAKRVKGKSGATNVPGEKAGKARGESQEKTRGKAQGKTRKQQAATNVPADDPKLAAIVQEELKKQEKRRKMTVILCTLLAACCLGYFIVYSYYDYRVNANLNRLNVLKDMEPVLQVQPTPALYYADDKPKETPEVLDEYKNLANKNKRLIGWVKIDDTNIDYPVVQTVDNEYYLTHDINQEYDRNGTIFMDKDCDVLKPSTNFILYGHHMKSGAMFGNLHLYEDEDYGREHSYIQFDTLYEKGTYEVMYVFRSRVYSEEEIVFKYYQFIDALSEIEFNSYMQEMAAMSMYDTGVTAEYGDQLLTLSTCDYGESNGRFVVVARKV